MEQMDLQDLVRAVHALYNSDTDAPDVADDDGLLYTALLNNAISVWVSEGVDWDQLWLDIASAATGDKNAVAGQVLYDLPTDYRMLGGFVKIVSSDNTQYVKYNVVKPAKARQLAGSGRTYCYVTGSPKTGYKLRLSVAPTTEQDNWEFDYDYYKTATSLVGEDDISECPDPYFLVHHAVSELKKADDDAYGHSTSLREAEDRLKVLRSEQMKLPEYEENTIEILDDYGFGV
jgi:hypothetical protein